MAVDTKTVLVAIAALAVIAVGYKIYRVGEKVITQDLNPANENNLVNRSATAVVTNATGRDETLGGWFYDLTHRDPVAQMEAATAAALKAKK